MLWDWEVALPNYGEVSHTHTHTNTQTHTHTHAHTNTPTTAACSHTREQIFELALHSDASLRTPAYPCDSCCATDSSHTNCGEQQATNMAMLMEPSVWVSLSLDPSLV